MAAKRKPKAKMKVETLTHDGAVRKHIPTAEYEAMLSKEDRTPLDVAYERCNRDLDLQLVWRGKDTQDWSDLVVHAPPLYIQEKVHPKVLIEGLKNTGRGNLFVIFGEPDIDITDAGGGQIQVKINGVDVCHPQTGEVRSDGADGIACWFIDTDYNEESFFARHAYFLGANDPYKALKTTLKADVNQEAWEALNRDTSRPFNKPKSGRIAVKVINHLGDEVMKVFRV